MMNNHRRSKDSILHRAFFQCSNDTLLHRAFWMLGMFLVPVVIWQAYQMSVIQHEERETAAKLRIAYERMGTIVAVAPIPIIMCESPGGITEFNPEAEQLFRCKREDVIGKSLKVLIPESLREAHVSKYAETSELLRKKSEPWEVYNRAMDTSALRKDGTTVPVRIYIRGITYAGKVEYIATMRPIGDKPVSGEGPLDTKALPKPMPPTKK